MLEGCVHYLVYTGKQEAVFWTSLIQIDEIHARSPLSSFLEDHYHVGQLVWVEYFLDKPDF